MEQLLGFFFFEFGGVQQGLFSEVNRADCVSLLYSDRGGITNGRDGADLSLYQNDLSVGGSPSALGGCFSADYFYEHPVFRGRGRVDLLVVDHQI